MRHIEHVQQPHGSKLCGHACIAMVQGISLADAVDLVGHRKAMRNYEVIKALGMRGKFKRASREPEDFPEACIIRLRWEPRYRHHLALFVGPRMYDPLHVTPSDWRVWFSWSSHRGGRIVSYLPVEIS